MSALSEKKVKWIAVTGTIGSGKSSVVSYLKAQNYPVVDCDKIAHQCYEKGEKAYHQMIDAFSDSILKEDGTIDRLKVAQLIFNDEMKKKTLENILHPQILEKLFKERRQCKARLMFVEVPLLFEVNWQHYFDENWLVTSDEKVIVERLKINRAMDEESIKKRIQSQMSVDEKKRLADVIIENNADLKQLHQKIDELLERSSQ